MSCYTVAPLYVARKANLDVAQRLVDAIASTFLLLPANPGVGRQRPNLGAGMRTFPVNNYRIYYRQDARGRVRILHVKHAARDEKKLFG
jgi:toxin ParE1/3/4